jgi:hypothetical protein
MSQYKTTRKVIILYILPLSLHLEGVKLPNVMVEWSTLLRRIREVLVEISACRPAVLAEDFRGFPQSLQANARIVPQS